MLGANRLGFRDGCDRPRDPPDACVAAPGQVEAIGGAAQERVSLGIARWRLRRKPLARDGDAAGYCGGALARGGRELLSRGREASQGRGRTGRGARARACRGSERAVGRSSCTARRGRRDRRTGTGSWSRRAGIGPGRPTRPTARDDRDEAILERLAQRFERRPLELGQLVEEQDAAMREARLARPQVRRRRRRSRRSTRCDAARGTAARETSGCSPSTSPATEWIRVTSSADSESSGGRIPGSRRASIVFPVPGGPPRRTLWPPAAASSRARRARSCPRTSARSGAVAAPCPFGVQRRLGLQLELAAQVRDGLGEVPDRDRGDPGERRLPRGVRRAEQTLGAEPARTFGDREHAADAAQASVERQLADRGRARERAPRQLLRSARAPRARSAGRSRSPPCAARPARG